MGRDITEQKRAEDALRTSEEKYRSLIESSDAAIATFDADGRVLFANHIAAQSLGTTPEAMLGKSMHELFPLEVANYQLRAIREVIQTGVGVVHESQSVTGEQLRWYRTSIQPVRDASGNATAGLINAVDITDRIQMEQNLRTSEEKYRSLIESSDAAIVMLNIEGQVLFTNHIAAQYLGFTPEAIVGKSIYDLFSPELAKYQHYMVEQAIQSGEGAVYESQIIFAGQPRWSRLSVQPVRDAFGKITAGLINAIDITDRMLAAQKLADSEKYFRALIENTHDITSLVAADGTIRYESPSVERVLGYTTEEVIGENIFSTERSVERPGFIESFIHPDDIPDAMKILNEMHDEQGKARRLELRFRHKNGLWRYFEVTLTNLLHDPVIAGLVINSRDITERKLAENALRQSENQFQHFMRNIPGTVFILSSENRLVYCNPHYAESLHQHPMDILGKNLADYTSPELARLAHEENQQILQQQQPIKFAYTSTEDNRLTHWEIIKFPIIAEDGAVLIGGIGLDVTKEKHAEEALQQSETYLRSLVDSQTAFNIRVDMEGKFAYCNRRYEEKFGWYAPSLIGVQSLDMVLPEDHHKVEEAVAYCLNNMGSPVQVEIRKQTEHGGHLWTIWEFIAVRDPNGEVKEIQCVGFDITRQKQAEESLRQSEQRYRQMFELHGLPKLILDPQTGSLLDANPAAAQFYGYTVEMLKTLSIFDVNLSPVHEVKSKMAKAASQEMLSCQFIHRGADGNPRDVEVFTGPIEIEGQQRLYSIITDITEKERAKKALQEAHDSLEQRVIERTAELEKVKNRIEAIFNHSGDGILLLDIHRGIQQANYAFDSMFGVDENSYFGAELSAFFAPENTAALEKNIQDVAATHQNRHLEARAYRTDGTPFEVELSIAPVNRSNHSVFNLVCIIRDITDRKQTEADLKKYAAEVDDLYNLAPIGYHSLNAEGLFIRINDTALAWLGYSREEVVGKLKVTDVLAPPSVATFRDNFPLFKQQGWINDVELEFQRKDGSIFPVLLSATALYDENGQFLHSRSILYDITKLKQAEADLKKYAAEVHDLYNLAPTGYHSVNAEGLFTRVNDTELAWLGYSREEMVGKLKFADILTPPSLATFRDNFPLFKQQGWIKDLEFEIQRKDGSTFPAMLSATAIYDDNGQFLHSRSTLYDISELKKAQQAIAEERNLLRTLIDAIPDYIYIKDTRHRMVLSNAAHAASLGISNPSVAVGKRDSDFFPEAMAASFYHDEQILFETEAPIINIEERSLGKDGQEIWAMTSKVPLRNLSGEIIGLVGITRDISERKAQEAALRESEERYRTTLAAMSEGIVVQENSSAIRLCNAAAEQILGLSAEQMMGRTSIDPRWQAIHPDGSPFPGETHPAMVTLRTGQPQSNVTMGVHKPDGTHTWILINSQPLINPDEPEPYAVVTTFTDITERKLSEEALEQKHRTELEMQFYLKSLHQMSIEIAHSQTLDEFYKQTVELGLTHFGFERMGLLLYDHETGEAVGTYGTDKEGNLVAEHHLRLKPDDMTGILQKTLERSERFAVEENTPLFANFEPIGTGQNAAAALWNGEMLGWLAVDNAVSRRPISQAKLDILALYALTIGSLLARKRAEFALRESESRYRLLAENVKDVIVKFTPDGLRTFVTPSIYDLLGYHPEELVGRLVIEVIHPDDRQKRQETIWEALTSGAAFFNITQRMRHKDGHFIWADVTNTIVRDEQGKPIEIIGVIHDITERKNSEDALRESEEKFRQFIDSAPIASIITDENGMIALVNKEAEHRFGYARHELIGQTIELLVPEDMRYMHISHRDTFIATRSNKKHGFTELSARRKDGSMFPADIQLGFIHMPPNNMVMSFVIDVTQRKQAEESLKQALAHEKELGELKSRFVSMASHEFRTPLATILATTETLTIYRNKMNDEQINLRLDKIRQQVGYMKNIMDDVLQLARIQAGRVEFKPTDGDLDALCLQIIEEFDSQADTQERIRYTCPTTPFIFNFDERLMRHILSNLLSNALKYSGKEKPVFLDITDTESQVTLTIQDQGIGIPPEDLKHLFEPFHRATNVGTISGTGLGLSIAKQAIDLHQGTIIPESEIDAGTKFIVRLPKVRG